MEECAASIADEESIAQARQKEIVVYSLCFLCTVLFLSVILREYLKKFHFPYTVLLLAFGAGWGLLESKWEVLEKFTNFSEVDIVIQLFLPIIIYDYSFGMNPHMFVTALTQCLILAVPGFIFCTGLNAGFAHTVLSVYQWGWVDCILFGTILAATDPTAVIEILKDNGVSDSLISITEGESMLNSGLALVITKVLIEKANSPSEDIFLYILQGCLGAIAFGYISAMCIITILNRSENYMDIQVTFTFCSAYITYFICEFYLDLSGILAVVVMGVSLSSYKSSMKYDEGKSVIHEFWQTMSFWATSIIFTIAGLVITKENAVHFHNNDIGYVIASYFVTSVIRSCMIFLLSPIIRNFGYGLSWKCSIMLTWGGMRGAIGLALALIARSSDESKKLLIHVSGVILMTLLFNASTMHWLLKSLRIQRITNKNTESMAHAVALLRDAILTTEKVVRMNKHYAGVEWSWVRSVTQIENLYEKKGSAYTAMIRRAFEIFRGRCKECSAEIHIEPNPAERQQMETESRLSVLRALKTSVSNQHKGYGILRRTVGHLSTCIGTVTETPEKHLAARDVKERFLTIPSYVVFMEKHMMRFMEKLDIKNRQSRKQERLLLQETDSGRLRKKCIQVYLSSHFETVIYWTLLLNMVPIIGECVAVFRKYIPSNATAPLGNEMRFFEIFNSLLALVCLWDAAVRIGALGFRSYIRKAGNVIGFAVSISALVQIVYGIVLLSVYRNSYSLASLYVLIALGAFRLLRLFKIITTGIFTYILNQFCSVIYNAFDIAIGFIVAFEEIQKSAPRIIEFEEFASKARLEAENNIYEMLCYATEIEDEHPNITCAWRTHRASIYVLRNMEEFIEEMIAAYMIGKSDAEQLLEQIEMKMNETFSLPRYMKAKEGVKKFLKNVPWIADDEILERISENVTVRSFPASETIHEMGQKHSDIKVLYKGIVRVSGTSSEERKIILPNTDTVRYFSITGDFYVTLQSPQSFGLLGYLLNTPSETSVTAMKDSQLISITFETLSRIEEEFDDLSFYMWRMIALKIAFLVLIERKAYENWSEEKIKIHLEEAMFPDLENKTEFTAQPIIAAMVLIQGKVVDKSTDTVYIGPAYIPSRVRSLTILGRPGKRPRVVLALLREEKFHASSFMGWVDPEEIKHLGLCVVHGMRRISQHVNQQRRMFGHRPSFIVKVGRLISPKQDRLLSSDVP